MRFEGLFLLSCCRFEQLSGQPEWARPRKRPLVEDSSDEDDDDKGGLLQRTGNLLARSQALVKGTLDICTLKDVNIKKRAPVSFVGRTVLNWVIWVLCLVV